MSLNKVICFALLSSMPFAAMAMRSSTVPLNGGSALPNQSVVVSGTDLYENTFYDVVCNIKMTSKNPEISHIQVYTSNSVSMYVNMHPLPNNGQGLITTNEDNYLEIKDFRDYGSVEIRNLDRDYTMTVSNCIATPSVS